MKKLAYILFSILTFNQLAVASNVPMTENSVAVVDMQQIISGSSAAKNLREAAEKKSGEYEKEAKKLEDGLSKNNQDLSKQRSVLSEDAYAEKVREFENKIVEAQRNTQMKKIKLAQGFENGLGEISKIVSEIVENIAKDKQYTLVIPSTGLLYAKDNLDITTEVLEKLNVKMPTITLKIENQDDTKLKDKK